MKTNAPSREALTDALLDSASDAFDRERSRALARLRRAGLSDAMATLSLLATLTEASERVAPLPRKVRGRSGDGAEALAGKALPFRRAPR